MRNITFLFALFAVLVLLVVPVTAATKVFLLGGQSNMAGLGGYDSPLPAPYSAPQPDVQFWNYGPETQPHPVWNINYPGVGTGWVDLENGYGHEIDKFGPEITFGYTLKNMFPDDDIYLIKEGVTSQDLAVHWNSDGTGDIYNIFKSRVDAAMLNLTNAGLSPTIAGMIWMQGESDAMNHSYAVQYETNLTNLIQDVRTDFNTPDMPFVIGRITTALGDPADSAIVRTAQETVAAADPNVFWFNTDDLQMAYTAHYGTQGQIDLGIRFANEFDPNPVSYSFPEKDSAEFDYKYEMDVDPTNVSAINLDADVNGNTTADWANTGSPSTPATVADGVMTMPSDAVLTSGSTAEGLWPNVEFTVAEGFTFEINMKPVGGTPGTTVASAVLCPSDSTEIGMLTIAPDSQTVVGGTTQQNINTNDYHAYRIVRDADADGGLWWMWRDGELLTPEGLEKSGDLTGYDRVYFGPGISPSSYVGELEVDYVRMTEGAFAPTPDSFPVFSPPEATRNSANFGYLYNLDDNPTNPIEIDLDADGVADWATENGAPLTVDNGTMTIQNDGNIRSGVGGEGIWPSQAFTAADGFTFELSMQVIEQDDGYSYANCIVLAPSDNDEAIVALIGEDSLRWGNDVYLTGIDNSDGQHVFRIARDADADGGRWWMWRDEELVYPNGIVPTGSFPEIDSIYFGPAVSASTSGIVEVDYIRLDNDGSFAPGAALDPGDANGDGYVNVSDLGILATNYGTNGGVGWSDGDFTGDGAVNVSDLGILATSYGTVPAQSVPEPATFAGLLGLCLAGILSSARRRRS